MNAYPGTDPIPGSADGRFASPGGDGRYLDIEIPDNEPTGDVQEDVNPETPVAAAEAQTKAGKTGKGGQNEERRVNDGNIIEKPSIETGAASSQKPHGKVGSGNEIRRKMLEEKQAHIAAQQESEEKKETWYKEARQKLIDGVRETRRSVQRLREESIRAGKTEDAYEEEAQELVEKRASRFENSDMELIIKKMLKRISIPHAETTKEKFIYLVGLGMNRDLPSGRMKYWSKENYLTLYSKKVGKKIDAILDEERHSIEADYDALDEAIAQLEQEIAPEETELKAAA